jgi:hypothetical protein
MSNFSRKHYEAIANCVAIVEERIAIGLVDETDAFPLMVECLKWTFQQDNPKFDEAVFDKACQEVK